MTVQEFKKSFEQYMREEGCLKGVINSEWENVVTRSCKNSEFVETSTKYSIGSSTYDNLKDILAAVEKSLANRSYTSSIEVYVEVKHRLTPAAMRLPLEEVIDVQRTLLLPKELATILPPELREKYVWSKCKTSTVWGFK